MLSSETEIIGICFDPETAIVETHPQSGVSLLPQSALDELEAWDAAWIEDFRSLWLAEALDSREEVHLV